MSSFDTSIETWKLKRLIKNLDKIKGYATGMISFILPAKENIYKVQEKIETELGSAKQIKSRVNRQAVMSSLTSASERLKLYKRIPDNGLVIFSGIAKESDGSSEKKYVIDFEPNKPLTTFKYKCGDSFYTEPLYRLLESEDIFGFIIMDGNGCLFGTLQGNYKTVIEQFQVSLPKKHGRGGQSAPRFGRIRMEKRGWYISKVAEFATKHFIDNDKPNVKGLILAGAADFKKELSQSDVFDKRLIPIILKIVDISYGGNSGFNQAIKLSEDKLSNVKFLEEKKLVDKYFEEIDIDSGMIVFGVHDTITYLESGAIDTILCYEDLEIVRYELQDPKTGKTVTKYLKKSEESDTAHFKSDDSGLDFIIISSIPLSEWLCEHYKDYGVSLEFISNRTPEGNQFVVGFGGIGGFLRFKIDIQHEDDEVLDDTQDEFDEELDFI